MRDLKETILKKVLLVILTILCFSASDITSVDYGKIVFEDGCLVDCSVTDNDRNGDLVNMSQEVNQVIVKTQLNCEPFYNQKEIVKEDASYEEVEEYKTRYRARAQEYYSALNNEYFSKNKLNGYESVYVNKYSPQIEYSYAIGDFNANKNNIINTLARDNDVSKVYISNTYVERVECVAVLSHLYYMGEEEIYTNRDYTGNGVVIGILDLGLVDKSHKNFSGIDVTTYYQLGDTSGEHATQMASAFGGKYGIACKAKILSAALHGTMSNEVEWMIDKNVDVINMSYGNKYPDGTYGSESAYADYIIKTYDITICASVGNEGEYEHGYVSNPAMGYNVLSVGSCCEDAVHSDFSSYQVDTLCPPKPVIVTPGNSIKVESFPTTSGTSLSTALMTGSIALLYEETPSLKTDADKVLALVTCCGITNSPGVRDNGFHQYNGAGMYNYQNSLDPSFKVRRYSNTSGHIGSLFYGGYVNLNVGDTVKVTIASLINTNGSVNSVDFTDYDIKLFDSNGNMVAIIACNISNIEMLEYTATTAGRYEIYLYQASKRVNASDQICYAYRVYNESNRYIRK